MRADCLQCPGCEPARVRRLPAHPATWAPGATIWDACERIPPLRVVAQARWGQSEERRWAFVYCSSHGCHHAHLTAHLRLFHVLERAFDGLIVVASPWSPIGRDKVVRMFCSSGPELFRALIQSCEPVQSGRRRSSNFVSHPLNYWSRIR
jgi:hypothetical protein